MLHHAILTAHALITTKSNFSYVQTYLPIINLILVLDYVGVGQCVLHHTDGFCVGRMWWNDGVFVCFCWLIILMMSVF